MIPSRRPFISCAVALLALNGIVFWPVLTFDFVRWDDDINITHNPLLTELWSRELVRQIFSAEHALRFKPVHWLLARMVHANAGLDPAAWHALNLSLHLATGLLFYLVLRQVLALRGLRTRGAEAVALLAAAFWSLHPLRSEVVGWATASPYPLAALLLLGSFAFYLRAHRAGAMAWGWLAASWSLAVLGYGSYPVGVTYGLWLMAVDRWLLDVAETHKPIWWLKQGMFLFPAAIAVGCTVWSRYASPGIFGAAPDLSAVGWPVRLLFGLASLADLVWRGLWPVSLTPNLSPVAWAGATWVRVALLAVAAGMGLLFAWRQRSQRPLCSLIVFGFAALSVPCLGLTERPTWPVDRYSYVAHLVLIGGMAGAIAVLTGRRLALAGLMLLAAVLVSAIAARRQLTIWSDSESLFTHMEGHPHFGDNPRQQGHVYVMWANHEGAAGHPVRAQSLLNKAHETYFAGISSAVRQGDFDKALALMTHVERYFTLTPVLRREKAAWLLRAARPEEGARELEIAAKDLPGDERVRELRAEVEDAVKAKAATAAHR